MKNSIPTKHHQGFTLIELMIAMLIGTFLVSGAIQMFLSTKQSNRMQENLSRLQENGRFAIDYLGRDIRMTGYWGCMLPPVPNTDIAGTDGATGTADTIILKGAFENQNKVVPAPPVTNIGICNKSVNDAAIIAGGNTIYADLTSTITYTLNNNALNRATNNISGANADMVEGIENIQVLYGEDTDTTPDGVANYYVPAGSVSNMANVVSVRVSLLASTIEDNLTVDPIPYTFNGSTVTPTDHKIRRVFTTTILIRNRLP